MPLDTHKMLDQISTSIEAAVRTLSPARTVKKRMTLRAFVPYALAQIEKAGAEARDKAQRRLGALKRSVDQIAARVAKLNAEDLDSEKITVEVETAFAPTGDRPIEGLTTAPDQSSTEVAPTSVQAANGNTNFAENLGAVAKALQKLKADLDAKPAGREHTQKATPAAGADTQGWPLDLNSPSFRTGVAKAEDEPAWGYDPAGLRSSPVT